MGKIQAGILSAVSGKVAGVVGGRWKDKAYLRAYVIPANPRTAAQIVQRTKFSDTVNFAKLLIGQVFNPFTDKFQKSMSGYNFFIKRNIAEFDGSPSWPSIKVTEGVLSGLIIDAADLDGVNLVVSFTPNNGNNGLDTDQVTLVVYNKNTGIMYFSAASVDRVDGTIDLNVQSGDSANNLEVFLFAAQTVNNVLKSISNSVHSEVTAV